MNPDIQKLPDPLVQLKMPSDRLNYAAGILLDEKDFQTEQLYHRSQLARVLSHLQRSGTVAGLLVEYDAEGDQIRVRPGIAIDRLGRMIEVSEPYCIWIKGWYDYQMIHHSQLLKQAFHPSNPPTGDDLYKGIVVDVFLNFELNGQGKTLSFADTPFEALDAVTFSRIQDSFKVELLLRTEPLPVLPEEPGQGLLDGLLQVLSTTGFNPINAQYKRRKALDASQAELQDEIFAAWEKRQQQWDNSGKLKPLPEHIVGQDPTAIFLARLQIPAILESDEPPQRQDNQPILIDNRSRSFVYTPATVSQWLGF